QNLGTDQRRVDRAALQLLPGRKFGNREVASGDGIGLGGLPARLAGPLLHRGRFGQSSGGSAEAISARTLPRPTQPGGLTDLRRVGLSLVQSGGRRAALSSLRRSL